MDGVLIGCLYLPNGNPKPGPKIAYKLSWFKRLNTHATSLLRSGAPVVLAGDFNVAPTAIETHNHFIEVNVHVPPLAPAVVGEPLDDHAGLIRDRCDRALVADRSFVRSIADQFYGAFIDYSMFSRRVDSCS